MKRIKDLSGDTPEDRLDRVQSAMARECALGRATMERRSVEAVVRIKSILDGASNDLPDYVRIAMRAGVRATLDPKEATAARLTAFLKRESTPAVAHADRPEHTGAIPKPRMRVRRASGGKVPSGAPVNPTNAMADLAARIHGATKSRVRDDIQSLAVLTGKARRDALDRIRSIVHAYQDDHDMVSHIETLGWRIEA